MRKAMLVLLLVFCTVMIGAVAASAVFSQDGGVACPPTDTPVPEPTDTPIPEPTDTPVPEPTDTPQPEPTDTPQPEPTNTEVPTATPTHKVRRKTPVPTRWPKTTYTPTSVVVSTETPAPPPPPTVPETGGAPLQRAFGFYLVGFLLLVAGVTLLARVK